jgi:chromosome segregation ATPase
MSKFILLLSLLSFPLWAQDTVTDSNQNGLPDQHENAVLRAAERICNMPGIQDVLVKQIEDLKSDKLVLQKQIDDLKNKADNSLKEQINQCDAKLKDAQFEKDKVLADKDKVQLNLNDKAQELTLCKAKLDEKALDRIISAGLGVVGASSCFLYQEFK